MIFSPVNIMCPMGSIWVRCEVQGGRFDCLICKPLPREGDMVSGRDGFPSGSLEDMERRMLVEQMNFGWCSRSYSLGW